MYDNPLLHLALFAAWAIFLLVLIELVRSWLMSARNYPVTGFPAGERHGRDAYWRLYMAQANCLEFLPLYGTVVVAMIVSGQEIPPFFGLASLIIIAVRPLQSLVHIVSTSASAIRVRASLFLIQLTALATMCWLTVQTLVTTLTA